MELETLSYIVEYTYQDKPGPRGRILEAIVYYWQGEKCTIDEKGTSAMLAVKFDNEHFNGRATQVRVVQGKEPTAFLSMFGGHMIVSSGGKASGFKRVWNNEGHTDAQLNSEQIAAKFPKLFHIRSTGGVEQCMALQVDTSATSLNSNDVFVLVESPENSIVWTGKGANAAETGLGYALVTKLYGADATAGQTYIDEGQEIDEFWDALGGQAEYASSPLLQNPDYDPRLFQISNTSGALRIEECCDFTQEDLMDEDVMLLDTVSTVFVWIGNGANKEEKEHAPQIAQDYIDAATDGRDPDTPIVIVKAGAEPLLFTCQFVGWDGEKEEFVDFYEEMQKQRHPSGNYVNGRVGNARGSDLAQGSARFASQASQRAASQKASVRVSQDRNSKLQSARASQQGSLLACCLCRDPAKRPSSAGPPKPMPKHTVWKQHMRNHGADSAAAPGKNMTRKMKLGAEFADPNITQYSFEELKGANFPDGVDPTHKEQYLTDDVFQSLFGMSKADFNAQPLWKRKKQKKEHQLF